MLKVYEHTGSFILESGEGLEKLTIAYTTHGKLNNDASNVVWVCHALTANADPLSWWPGVVGEDCTINPADYFIVCANIIGSCYGSTTPTGNDFPLITIRDMVNAHIVLRKHLKIDSIKLLMGGSMGGYQVIEWAVMEPATIKNIFLIATVAKETAWGIAIHTSQRMALESGEKGLATARAIGMLTYRNYEAFVRNHTDTDMNKLTNFNAESYIRYQGDKLVKRFTPESYYSLTRSMDTHNIARDRADSVEEVLKTITQKTLIIGISSDHLCPLAEQQLMADSIPGNQFIIIDSAYGHDGFLVESAKIDSALRQFIAKLN
jgi:homoserine O-acetyltransferase